MLYTQALLDVNVHFIGSLHVRLPRLVAGSRRSTVNLGMMHTSGMDDARYLTPPRF